MSLFRIFDVAGSGMSAQTVRLNTVASNMARTQRGRGLRIGECRGRQRNRR